ncbi:MAG: Sec-independent protein translocase protein TatB [Symbiopectobacterium sp.]
MFDIGFSELVLVMVIGLVVLGPKRLPIAVKTIAGWIRTLRSLASAVQNELTQELKLQELQDSLKKMEQASLKNLSPELKASMDKLKEAADTTRRGHAKPGNSDTGQLDEVPHNKKPLLGEVLHKPLAADAEAAHQASSPAALPFIGQPDAAPSSFLIDVAPPAAVNSAPEASSATALPDNTPAAASVAATDDVLNKRAAPAPTVAPSQPSADER